MSLRLNHAFVTGSCRRGRSGTKIVIWWTSWRFSRKRRSHTWKSRWTRHSNSTPVKYQKRTLVPGASTPKRATKKQKKCNTGNTRQRIVEFLMSVQLVWKTICKFFGEIDFLLESENVLIKFCQFYNESRVWQRTT